MSTYLTPGVYTEEVSLLPPSVASVSTAIPAFIGFTEKAGSNDALLNKAVRISTFLEYKEYFGTAQSATFDVTVNSDKTSIENITVTPPSSTLYYALDIYFKNGGGDCYIISVGNYSNINSIPTAPPDSTEGSSKSKKTKTLSNLKGKFTDALNVLAKEDEPTLIVLSDAINCLLDAEYYEVCKEALEQCADLKDRFCIFDIQQSESVENFRTGVSLSSDFLKYGAAYTPYLQTLLNYKYKNEDVTISISGSSKKPSNLGEVDYTEGTAIYSSIVSELASKYIVLPPSSAVAGVYAATDREQGVWKAPANVSLNSVIAPVEKISAKVQEGLNIHEGGKSVNAIRSFVGKGTLVWGARTLDGNSNEWRYVSVRRLFNMIEESTKKASEFAVFEPNDAATWLKVKAMIESFLYGVWQQGGLAGSTDEQAYFVNIGLGKTMTQQDILEGRMIVEIGIAAARPAEFIILKFSHKLQEV